MRQEQSDALPGTGAELYALLVKSEAAPAEEDMPSLCPTASYAYAGFWRGAGRTV